MRAWFEHNWESIVDWVAETQASEFDERDINREIIQLVLRTVQQIYGIDAFLSKRG